VPNRFVQPYGLISYFNSLGEDAAHVLAKPVTEDDLLVAEELVGLALLSSVIGTEDAETLISNWSNGSSILSQTITPIEACIYVVDPEAVAASLVRRWEWNPRVGLVSLYSAPEGELRGPAVDLVLGIGLALLAAHDFDVLLHDSDSSYLTSALGWMTLEDYLLSVGNTSQDLESNPQVATVYAEIVDEAVDSLSTAFDDNSTNSADRDELLGVAASALSGRLPQSQLVLEHSTRSALTEIPDTSVALVAQRDGTVHVRLSPDWSGLTEAQSIDGAQRLSPPVFEMLIDRIGSELE